MSRLWIYLALYAIAVGVAKAQYDDYWEDTSPEEYDWYPDLKLDLSQDNPLKEKSTEEKNDDTNEMDQNVDEEIETLRKELENEKEKDDFDPFDDYQFEDNRSDIKEELTALASDIDKAGGFADNDGSFEAQNVESSEDDTLEEPEADESTPNNDNENIFKETQDILTKDNKESNDFKSIEDFLNESDKLMNDLDSQILEETEHILSEDSNDPSKEDKINNDNVFENNKSEDSDDDKEDNDSNNNEENNLNQSKNDKIENDDIFDETKAILNEEDDMKLGWGNLVDNVQEDVNPIDEVNNGILNETKNILNEDDEDDINNIVDEKVDDAIWGEPVDINVEEPVEITGNLLKQPNEILDEDDSNDIVEDDNDYKELKYIIDQLNKALKDSNDEEKSSDDTSLEKDMQDIIDETKNLLQDSDSLEENLSQIDSIESNQKKNDNSLDKSEDTISDDEASKLDENDESAPKEENINSDSEDTVDKVYEDLDEDLKQLFETWDKLTNDKSDEDDDVLKYEEKYGKPFREDVVLSQREEYENIDDANLSDLFVNDKSSSAQSDEETDEDSDESNSASLDKERQQEPKYYKDDALVASDENKDSFKPLPEDESEPDKETNLSESVDADIANTKPEVETGSIKTTNVDNLTPSQYDELMRQFAQVHSEALNTQDEGFGDHIAPIHISINVDEPVVIESPNFPQPYPTNNIIDWIFDGEGMGIEFNVTEFSVNGIFGDYLLVKPGGADATGTDGLLFSYHLNEPRRYRFLDVDRLFVRFVANPGIAFFRGFQFSVRMIAPIPEEIEEPETAPLLPHPPANLTVNLGGITPRDFDSVHEEFRQLIADMATLYINANEIDMGMNTTSETTQIINATLCNVNWPNFENCTEVRFGVPLVYEDDQDPRLNEDDLRAMWYTYIYRDPFALRLRRMGVTEFAIPNDSKILMVWVVIAVGVLISMALLAFALWRFSCYEDYRRAATFSDTDSIINEKRNLDLYPTPHQSLPPLYTENEYKWDDGKYEDSGRVDMGGFTNSSYMRDSLYDIESDEEVAVTPWTPDKNPVTSRDIYQV